MTREAKCWKCGKYGTVIYNCCPSCEVLTLENFLKKETQQREKLEAENKELKDRIDKCDLVCFLSRRKKEMDRSNTAPLKAGE